MSNAEAGWISFFLKSSGSLDCQITLVSSLWKGYALVGCGISKGDPGSGSGMTVVRWLVVSLLQKISLQIGLSVHRSLAIQGDSSAIFFCSENAFENNSAYSSLTPVCLR